MSHFQKDIDWNNPALYCDKNGNVNTLQTMTLEWLQKVEKKMGVRPKGPDNFDWQIWQKTEKGQMGGHKGNIDINLFRGNYDVFKKYIDQ